MPTSLRLLAGLLVLLVASSACLAQRRPIHPAAHQMHVQQQLAQLQQVLHQLALQAQLQRAAQQRQRLRPGPIAMPRTMVPRRSVASLPGPGGRTTPRRTPTTGTRLQTALPLLVKNTQPRAASPEAAAIARNSVSPTFANYLVGYRKQLEKMPSILDPQPVPASTTRSLLQKLLPAGPTGSSGRLTNNSKSLADSIRLGRSLGIGLSPADTKLLAAAGLADLALPQALRIGSRNPQAGVNYLNYMMSPQGKADLLTLGGYGRLNRLPAATDATARLIYNDPFISRQSGQWITNATNNYITDRYGRGGVSNMNLLGVAKDFGLMGALGGLQYAPNMGGLMGSRPPGTGSGSPFIDAMGPPIGSNPRDRWTWPGF